MSLSKGLCLRSDSQNSHSFSDRFCDDLCEDILQYLSLEDKLRIECVSKQFQRTVFQRQYELYINVQIQRVFWSESESDFNYLIQSLDLFKALLKKCPNIRVFAVILASCYYGSPS